MAGPDRPRASLAAGAHAQSLLRSNGMQAMSATPRREVQHVRRRHAATREKVEQRVLGRGQSDRSATEPYFVCALIDHEVPEVERRIVIQAFAPSVANCCSNAGAELLWGERLHDVIVGAKVEPTDAIRDVNPAGHDQDWRARYLAHMCQEIEPSRRYSEVQDHDIDRFPGNLVENLQTIPSFENLRTSERVPDQTTGRCTIRDQHPELGLQLATLDAGDIGLSPVRPVRQRDFAGCHRAVRGDERLLVRTFRDGPLLRHDLPAMRGQSTAGSWR